MNDRVSHHSSLRNLPFLCLELGLYQYHKATALPDGSSGRRNDLSHGNKGDVDGHKVKDFRQDEGITGVYTLFHDYARISTKSPVELTFPDIDGIDPRSTSLEKAIREAPCRSPDITRHLAPNIDSEDVEGMLKLDPSPPNEGVRHGYVELSVDGHGHPWFGQGTPIRGHLPSQHQSLGQRLVLGETSLDQQKVNALTPYLLLHRHDRHSFQMGLSV